MPSYNPELELNDAITELRPKLKALIDRHLSNGLRVRVDASDIVQETFAKAMMRGDLRRDNGIPLAALLFKLAKQGTVDNFRKHLRAKQRSISSEVRLPESDGIQIPASHDTMDDPSNQLSSLETRSCLFDAIGKLEKRNQEILFMRYFEEMSVKEIAGTMGVSPESISKRLMRSLKKLNDKLQNTDLNQNENDR